MSNGSLDLAIVSHDEASIAEIARRPLHVESLVSHRLALVCAQGSPWIRAVRALPKIAVPARALTQFPLIVPEPDAGVRKAIDLVLHREGLQNRLNIVLELGGWATIITYVQDAVGVGVVSEGRAKDKRLDDPTAGPGGVSADRGEADLPAAGEFGGRARSVEAGSGVARGAPAGRTRFLT